VNAPKWTPGHSAALTTGEPRALAPSLTARRMLRLPVLLVHHGRRIGTIPHLARPGGNGMTLAVRITTAGVITMNNAMVERFVVQIAPDRFDVIAGSKLNSESLTLADANMLARRASASLVSICGDLVNGTKPKPSDDFDRRRRRDAADTTQRH
jgi:hypothetical protein